MIDHTEIAVVAYEKAALPPPPRTPADALRYVTLLLSMLPATERAGFLLKPGGDNIAPLSDGSMVSCSRVCYPDGQIFKVMSDAPNGSPQWADNGLVPIAAYRALGDVGPTQPPAPVNGYDPVRFAALEALMQSLEQILNEIVKQLGIINEQAAKLDARIHALENVPPVPPPPPAPVRPPWWPFK